MDPQKLRNVLGHQDVIQSGETLIDQQWFEKPEKGEVAFKLELFVANNDEYLSVAVEVVNLLTDGNNDNRKRES